MADSRDPQPDASHDEAKRRRRIGSRWLHPLRILAIAFLIAMIPRGRQDDIHHLAAPPSHAFSTMPEGAEIASQKKDGRWPIQNEKEQVVGYARRSLPAAAGAIGYRGITEAAIRTDLNDRIVEVSVLESEDTDEHVLAVTENESFLAQYQGLKWPDELPDQVDGVSGATLTSLAMAEGIRRAAGSRAAASTLFPDDLAKGEQTFGEPKTNDSNQDALAKQTPSLQVIRTGPLVDTIAGYQGPTELLMAIDANDLVVDLKIRDSYDNSPYVGYVKTEAGFWKHFKNQNLTELSSMTLEASGIEGVSGATMTSLAVAETVFESSKRLQARRRRARLAKENVWWKTIPRRITFADLAALALLIVLLLAKLPVPPLGRWFQRPWVRRGWLSTVVLVIGFWSGNLLSLTLLSGWATSGIAWRLAPVLAIVFLVSILLPPANKSNPYCNHLCPHGAIQQLVLPGRKRRRSIPRWLRSGLGWVPGGLLTLAYLGLLFRTGWDYSTWEPFHAYRPQLASIIPIALAIASLLAAIWIPMAYCRHGCPTGRFLDYIRRRGVADRLGKADVTVLILVTVALAKFTSGN